MNDKELKQAKSEMFKLFAILVTASVFAAMIAAFIWVYWAGVQKKAPLYKKSRKDLILSENKTLPPEAVRALAEADERRKKTKIEILPKELGGRDGPEPVRFGDWERKGIAIDF